MREDAGVVRGAGCAPEEGDRVRADRQGEGGELEELIVEFSPWPPTCSRCATGCKELGVTHVAMEATGVYWKPV